MMESGYDGRLMEDGGIIVERGEEITRCEPLQTATQPNSPRSGGLIAQYASSVIGVARTLTAPVGSCNCSLDMGGGNTTASMTQQYLLVGARCLSLRLEKSACRPNKEGLSALFHRRA